MTKLSAAKVRENFSDIISQVAYGKERIILTRQGKELVSIVPIEDLKLLETIENEIDIEQARKELNTLDKEGTTCWEDIKKAIKT